MPKSLFHFEVEGEKQAAFDLLELGVRAKDLRPASRKLFRVFEQAEKAQFASGRGWAPLSEKTLENKSNAGFPDTILVQTGALRDSLTGAGEGGVRELREGELTFGTNLRYAHFALGTETQPARPLIKLRLSDTAKLTAVLTGYIVKGET